MYSCHRICNTISSDQAGYELLIFHIEHNPKVMVKLLEINQGQTEVFSIEIEGRAYRANYAIRKQ